MLYSKPEKIEHILSSYNIRPDNGHNGQGCNKYTSFNLINLKSNAYISLNVLSPLYNNLKNTQLQQDQFTIFNGINDSIWVKCEEDSIYVGQSRFNNYNITKYGNTRHFGYITKDQIININKCANINVSDKDEVNVDSIFGNYYTLTNGNLYHYIFPDIPVIENIDNVLYTNYFINKHDSEFSTFTIIYTSKDDPTNLKLYYNNELVQTITSTGIVDVSLSDIFKDTYPTLINDLISEYNKSIFIVESPFNVGIFINRPDRLLRYIPIYLHKAFFKTYNKMKEQLLNVNINLCNLNYKQTLISGQKNNIKYPSVLFNSIKSSDIFSISDIYSKDVSDINDMLLGYIDMIGAESIDKPIIFKLKF